MKFSLESLVRKPVKPTGLTDSEHERPGYYDWHVPQQKARMDKLASEITNAMLDYANNNELEINVNITFSRDE